MWHNVFAAMTATAMLFHALLGCCHHHPHTPQNSDVGCSVHAEPQAVVEDVHDHGHGTTCHSERHSHADAETAHPPGEEPNRHDREHEPCQELDCSFIASAPVKLPSLDCGTAVDTLALANAVYSAAASRTLVCSEILADASMSARVRMRTQVWLL